MTNSVQKFFILLVLLLSPVLVIHQAHAAHAVDHTGWKVDVGGYIDLDSIYDSTRSFTEVENNGPVAQGLQNGTTAAQGGSINGDNPRYQESARSSRIRVFATAPELDGWKATGYFETDFLGFEPTIPGAAPSAESEHGGYTNPTLRMRLAQVEFSKDDWKFMAGQGWDIFGWQPYYELSNLTNDSVINLVKRTPELVIGRDLNPSDTLKVETAISITKGEERDAAIPDLNIGANISWSGRKAGYMANSHKHADIVPTSLQISGQMSQFSTPNTDGDDADKTGYQGGAFSVSTIIPIITSDGTDTRNSMTILAEFARGTGLANQYASFNGGFGTASSAYVTGAAGSTTQFQPNLDAGYAGWDSTGTLQLINTQEYTVQLQYFLPFEHQTVVNVEYGHLQTTNTSSLFNTYGPTFGGAAQTAATQATYDYNELYAANIYHNLTPEIVIAGEYDRILTHYTQTGNYPVNNRLEFSVFYLF